jgi:hypothetical protein
MTYFSFSIRWMWDFTRISLSTCGQRTGAPQSQPKNTHVDTSSHRGNFFRNENRSWDQELFLRHFTRFRLFKTHSRPLIVKGVQHMASQRLNSVTQYALAEKWSNVNDLRFIKKRVLSGRPQLQRNEPRPPRRSAFESPAMGVPGCRARGTFSVRT